MQLQGSIAASLFGFAGMILGVPVFAILYMLISDDVNDRLRRKHRTTETAAYFAVDRVDDLPDPAEPAHEETEQPL